LGLPLIYLLTIISVVGIPLLPFVYFTFLIMKWLGMAGFFLFFGRRLGKMVKRQVSVLGGVLLGFLFFGVLKLVPFIGAALWLGFGWYGLGLVLLTRCGTRRSGVPVTAPLPTPTPPDAPVEPSETVD
jgi:hypothetical protein